MMNMLLIKRLMAAGLTALVTTAAVAGFTISVKPLKPPQPVAAAATAVSAPVPTPSVAPVKEVQKAPVVSLQIAKGARLNEEIKQFLSPHGWTPAWLAGEIVAGDAITFEGATHEEALKAFLSHYDLVGERFESEKGYVIRRAGAEKAGAN